MKKLLAYVLAMMMLFMVGTAFAAEIALENVLDGETYTAYKILNYSQSGTAISYYLDADDYTSFGSVLEAAGFAFTASSDGAQYYVNNSESFDAAAAAAYLSDHCADLGDALGKVSTIGADGSASFTNLDKGYYFVTSSAGTLCALHSDDEIAKAVEKNTVPEEDKKQSAEEGTGYTDDTLDFNIGDTVYYQVEIKDGKGTASAITLQDTMTAGLTYQNNAKVFAGDNEITPGGNTFTLTNASDGFTIVFAAAYVAGLNENEIITVKYSAVINSDAIIDSDANTNTVEMTYSEQSQTDVVKIETYDFTLEKVDESNAALSGAKFNLFKEETGGAALIFKKDDTGYYLSTAEGAEAAIDAGDGSGVNIRGLAPGTYWLEETVVPDGYNKLAERVKVTIVSGAEAPAKVKVENKAGTELPSTGGMGTTIFYVIGGLLIIGAAVVLVARRKAHD